MRKVRLERWLPAVAGAVTAWALLVPDAGHAPTARFQSRGQNRWRETGIAGTVRQHEAGGSSAR